MKKLYFEKKNNSPMFILLSVFMFISIMFMSVGYSALNTELNITGEAAFRVDADIRVTDCSINGITNGGLENYPCNYSKDSLITEVTLPNLNSTVTYNVTITNIVDVDMLFDGITNNNFNNTNMEYTLSNINVGDTISGISSVTFQITFKYKDTVTILPENTVLGSQLKFELIEKSFELTVDANGGTWSGTTPQTIVSGDTVTINNPTRTNYTFTGWTLTGAGSSINGTTFTMGTENATLTANWTLITYTLTVDANSGTWGGTTPQTLTSGSTVTIVYPTRTGYMFNGWTVSGTGSSINGTTFTMGSANATLTANWIAFANMFTYTGTYTIVDDGNSNFRIRFTSSGTFTPLYNMTIDVFLVGGGGGGSSQTTGTAGKGGGGGGYTATYTSIVLSANTGYAITVGNGGGSNTAGGQSKFTVSYVVNGGYGGSKDNTNGAAGGSGGGAGSKNATYGGGGDGGSDGSNGESPYYTGGTGQGTTTREFRETDATKYGGGGGGGQDQGAAPYGLGADGGGNGGYRSQNGKNGTANTGGGGGGAGGYNASTAIGGTGGSGIVIIRNHR